MRRAPRHKDGNHVELRDGCRRAGISWLDIIPSAGGEPDALLGWRGVNKLVEVKDPKQPPNRRELRQNQQDWHRSWRGDTPVKVETMADIMRLFQVVT
jgi:hypothetical protein